MSGSNSSPHDAKPQTEVVSFTVHAGPIPHVDALAKRTRLGRWKLALVLLVCAAPVLASYLTYYVLRPDARSNYGRLIQPSRAVPSALALTSLQGVPVAAATLKGQWLLVTVGPGDCPGDCRARLFMQRQLREMLGRERERVDKVWLVTGSAALPSDLQAAASPDAALHVLRANPAELAAWLEPEPGQALQDHLYVVDPMGEWMMRFPAQAQPERVKRDLERLLRASAFWDRAGR